MATVRFDCMSICFMNLSFKFQHCDVNCWINSLFIDQYLPTLSTEYLEFKMLDFMVDTCSYTWKFLQFQNGSENWITFFPNLLSSWFFYKNHFDELSKHYTIFVRPEIRFSQLKDYNLKKFRFYLCIQKPFTYWLKWF